MNPRIISCLYEGYKQKIKQEDYLAWVNGRYTMSAVATAVEHCLNGRKAKSEYIKEPLFLKNFEDYGLTEEEIYERELKKALLAEEQWIRVSKEKGLPETSI